MLLKSKLYQILGYLEFIFVPFIAGLVIVFRDMNANDVEIYTLVINLVVTLVLSIILSLASGKGLPALTKLDLKYLLFGFLGNIIIYFYTFQNALEIEKFVTIYIVILLILVCKYLIFDRTFRHKELWISMLVFFIVDIINLIFHCGFYEQVCNVNHSVQVYCLL